MIKRTPVMNEQERKSLHHALRRDVKQCSAGEAGELGCTPEEDAELLADGWQQRFVADERMGRDAVETYGTLGYEVRLVPLNTAHLGEQCGGCEMVLKKYSVVYTRRRIG